MPPRKKKAPPASVGLPATEVASGEPPREIRELVEAVRADGGTPLCTYRDPFGGHWLVFAALPLDKVEPTPYQRELSPTHVARLASVIPKVGRFLDPVIATRHDGSYWSPNGMHRLAALKALGARAVTVLLVPEREVTYRILALNVEKAHAIKDKSLEAIRMARALAAAPETARKPESTWAFEFEEPAFLTLGLCYEARPRFSGGVYHPILRRLEEFFDRPIAKSLQERAARAEKLLELDDAVNEVVAELRAAGLKSPYLKPFVVARVNPLRFARASRPGQRAPRAAFDATIDKMIASARKLDARQIKPSDLAHAAAFAASGAEVEPEA